jgi:DnaK suppressor protein
MNAPLDTTQRDALRSELLKRREALLGTLALHQGGASRVQHARDLLLQDGDDGPQRDADREVDLAFTDHERHELAEIGAALKRLDDDGYGVCADCGSEIPFARLKVQPQALRCVGCESSQEGRRGGVPHALM